MKNKKQLLVSILIIVLAISGFGVYKFYKKSSVHAGEKNITVIVEDAKHNKEEFKHKTDAEMLGQALDEMKLVRTEDSTYGRIVMGVNGIDADMNKTEWWKFTINDVDSVTGVDGTPIKDGDTIKFIFTIGW